MKKSLHHLSDLQAAYQAVSVLKKEMENKNAELAAVTESASTCAAEKLQIQQTLDALRLEMHEQKHQWSQEKAAYRDEIEKTRLQFHQLEIENHQLGQWQSKSRLELDLPIDEASSSSSFSFIRESTGTGDPKSVDAQEISKAQAPDPMMIQHQSCPPVTDIWILDPEHPAFPCPSFTLESPQVLDILNHLHATPAKQQAVWHWLERLTRHDVSLEPNSGQNPHLLELEHLSPFVIHAFRSLIVPLVRKTTSQIEIWTKSTTASDEVDLRIRVVTSHVSVLEPSTPPPPLKCNTSTRVQKIAQRLRVLHS